MMRLRLMKVKRMERVSVENPSPKNVIRNLKWRLNCLQQTLQVSKAVLPEDAATAPKTPSGIAGHHGCIDRVLSH